MIKVKKMEIIDMELDKYYAKEYYLYYITKKDQDDITMGLIYKNVDLLLENILDRFTYKDNKKLLNSKDLLYFDNVFKNAISILNNKTKDGDTLLHNMVFFGSYEIVNLLLKYGAKINIEDNDKQIPLHRSIFLSDMKIFKLLIDNSINLKNDINHQDKDGNTPLHLAIIIKNYSIINNLLKFGADPYILNYANIIPLELAKSDNKEFDNDIIQIFKKYNK